MAPLPANSTGRIFFDYVTGVQTTSKEHTVMWRFDPANQTQLQAQGAFLQFLTLMTAGNFRQGWKVIRVRVAQPYSDFSFPVAVDGSLAGFVGTNVSAYPQNREAEEWTWQGRSPTTGKRVDFSVYGISSAAPANFRYPVGAGSPAWVGQTVDLLNSFASTSAPLVIDGTRPIWYQYVNEQANSYWEGQIRRG